MKVLGQFVDGRTLEEGRMELAVARSATLPGGTAQ